MSKDYTRRIGDSKRIVDTYAINSSEGADDADRIIKSNDDGLVDLTFMPDGIDADTLDGYDATDFVLVSEEGIDADKLDGYDASDFILAEDEDSLDVDKVDGYDASDFATSGHNHAGVYVAVGDYEDSDVLAKIKNVDGTGSGLDADKLDGQEGSYYLPSGSYTAADVLTKIKTVDGDDSGLDADLLGGADNSVFMRYKGTIGDAADLNNYNTVSGFWIQTLSSYAANGDNYPQDYAGMLEVYYINATFILQVYTVYSSFQKRYFRWYWGGWGSWARIWDSGSDGSGSGLDADLLDGSHLSALQKVSGLDAGTVSVTGDGTRDKSISVSFSKTFGSTPIVVATSKYDRLAASVSSVTTTGFTLRLSHLDAATWSLTYTAAWVAIDVG